MHTYRGEEQPFVFHVLHTLPPSPPPTHTHLHPPEKPPPFLSSAFHQLNLFSGLILAENHMARDIMGAGSRERESKREERREHRERERERERTASPPLSDVSTQACRGARWGRGGGLWRWGGMGGQMQVGRG